MLQAGILTIGDEILLGEIIDTNTGWLARQLIDAGLDPALRLSVGDDKNSILAALQFASSRCKLLIVTGGLGPTKDDISKTCLAEFFDSPLEENKEALSALEEKLRKRGREMNELVRTQALHPKKAGLLPNKAGTAPGIWFKENAFQCIALPGVPYEMKQIFEDEVMPELRKLSGSGIILHRFFRTACIPETQLAIRLEEFESLLPSHLKLAYLPSGGEVKLRLTGRAAEKDDLTSQLNDASKEIIRALGDDIYAKEDKELATIVCEMLRQNEVKLLIADDAIAGRLRQKIREAGQFPEIIEEKKGIGIEFEIQFERTEEGGDVEIRLHCYKNSFLFGESKQAVKPFSIEEIFHNMLVLRGLDMIRRQLLHS